MNYADDTEDFDDDVSYDERENQDFDDRCEFADPGGRSALRAGPTLLQRWQYCYQLHW